MPQKGEVTRLHEVVMELGCLITSRKATIPLKAQPALPEVETLCAARDAVKTRNNEVTATTYSSAFTTGYTPTERRGSACSTRTLTEASPLELMNCRVWLHGRTTSRAARVESATLAVETAENERARCRAGCHPRNVRALQSSVTARWRSSGECLLHLWLTLYTWAACWPGGWDQQMRGSCSPESMSTMRVPPTRVFMRTMPG